MSSAVPLLSLLLLAVWMHHCVVCVNIPSQNLEIGLTPDSMDATGLVWRDTSTNKRDFTWAKQAYNGANGFISTAGNSAVGPPQTFSLNGDYTIVLRIRSLSDSGFAFFFPGTSGSTALAFQPTMSTDNKLAFDQGGCCDASQRLDYPITSNEYTQNRTYVLMRKGSQRLIYRDGSMLASSDVQPANVVFDSSQKVLLAKDNWNGDINSFLVYSRALSDAEIAQVHIELSSYQTVWIDVDPNTNYAVGKGASSNSWFCVMKTSFHKLEFNPDTLLVNQANKKYATTEILVDNGCKDKSGFPYGVAASCSGPPATSMIDLTGTGYKVASTFSAAGYLPHTPAATVSNFGQVVKIEGGGSCGWAAPSQIASDEDLSCIGGFYLKLERISSNRTFEESLRGYVIDYDASYSPTVYSVLNEQTATSCSEVCNKDAACAGFILSTTNQCKLASAIAPPRVTSISGVRVFFKLTDPALQYTTRYNYLPKSSADFLPRGVQISSTATTTKACVDLCEANTGCVGVVYRPLELKCSWVNDSFPSYSYGNTSKTDDGSAITYYKPTALMNPNYESYEPNTQSLGKIVRRTHAKAVADCADLCDSTYKCFVFEYSQTTGACVLKDSYIPSPRTGVSLYRSMTASLVVADLVNAKSLPFLIEHNANYVGSDIKEYNSTDYPSGSFHECLAFCQKDASCSGIVFTLESCVPKTEMLTAHRTTDSAEYPSAAFHKTRVCKYDVERALDYFPYAGPNLEKCAAQCDAQNSCVGFEYGPDNVCWLDNGDGSARPAAFRAYKKNLANSCD